MRCSLNTFTNVGEETWLTARADNHVSNNDFATRSDHTRKVRARKPTLAGVAAAKSALRGAAGAAQAVAATSW